MPTGPSEAEEQKDMLGLAVKDTKTCPPKVPENPRQTSPVADILNGVTVGLNNNCLHEHRAEGRQGYGWG